MKQRELIDDRHDSIPSVPAAWDHQFDGAARGRYRDLFQAGHITHLAAAMAVYLVLLAGLLLHGLDAPDPTPTSSLTNTVTVPAMQHRRDRE
ncbi:hypothetical protein SAMN04488498_11476 [Mesorhizobium albiziae]|uniref:Uncharacterized protein n=1 Tax=Neomesorhizobium albiziae TaxID=335020 RepID=A0A1I4CTJ8_9HYPH|nr:hypothetical protein [Mesorhizobium albiziae]GLS31001.1 hypothetical protein GCM10007937_27100 [Mesorhizobium albiziae]SFK84093.1 hypothetical protein SAMN04488498_11476 [Mesorhizobium albiziae]